MRNFGKLLKEMQGGGIRMDRDDNQWYGHQHNAHKHKAPSDKPSFPDNGNDPENKEEKGKDH